MLTESYWDGENWLELRKYKCLIKYYLNGKLHRNDGPAFIGFYNDGLLGLEQYYINGLWYRINGPVIIEYHKNGSIKKEKYYFNSKKHRKDGPAEILFNNEGDIHFKKYYFNGKEFNPEDLSFELPIDTEEKEFMFKLKNNHCLTKKNRIR